jgi:hypothetical protein
MGNYVNIIILFKHNIMLGMCLCIPYIILILFILCVDIF